MSAVDLRTPGCDGVTSRHLARATIQTNEAMEMPKVSRESAPQRQEDGWWWICATSSTAT
jgi:hypothetical protein